MEELFSLGLSEEDIRDLLEKFPNVLSIDSTLIKEKIEILRYVDCNQRHIKNIIVSNPEYLDRDNKDILKLISYLKDVGFSLLNLLFDSNPYFLNYDVFEIRDYIDNRLNDGLLLEDIIDEIENNPYIIDEF